MKKIVFILLLITVSSCSPYRDLHRYNKKLQKWDEYFEKQKKKQSDKIHKK